MKRVVAITIMLVMVTTLFAFSVYADTPVQPLQVVTYSDTTTNVRISGTAERLHYNVDSFQVVFMNPPNNYGTACTPVLVSFRFYNSSELPAYVGQAEFELTATTSTGSVNTIIYGYDQISTDLFVAESSYSTAEVGRIGIGASNDFAYYTGFVIPPKTSLYFSCIVYVNASAYGQNNTGATEDVNQVTLSALNLYNNQISFSADYPYHNQPIDFTNIIDAIENLSETVSTSSEMSDLINLLQDFYDDVSYTGSVVNVPSLNNYYFQTSNTLTDSNNYVNATMRRFINKPIITNDTLVYDNTSDTYYHNYDYYVDVYYSIQINNTQSVPLRFAGQETFRIVPPYIGYDSEAISEFQSDAFDDYYFNSTALGTSLHLISKYIQESSRTVVIAPGAHNVRFVIRYIFSNSTSYNVTNITDSWLQTSLNQARLFNEEYGYSDSSNINSIRNFVKKIYESLTKNNNQDNSQEVSDMNDEIHEEEQVWYDNNTDALEAVGLSNYRFSQSQSNGITAAVTQFQAVWNALGQWTNVYIFILILSISTYIIRHEPTTRVKQYRSSIAAEIAERISYYGHKNAESRAAHSSGNNTLKSAVRRRR